MGFQQPKEETPLNPWLCNLDLWILGLIYAFEQKKKFKATLEIAKQWFCTIDHYSVYIKNNQKFERFFVFLPFREMLLSQTAVVMPSSLSCVHGDIYVYSSPEYGVNNNL